MQTIFVNLADLAPRIGSGWRVVQVQSIGRKWVHLRYQPRSLTGAKIEPVTARVAIAAWARLPKLEVRRRSRANAVRI